MKMPKVGLGVWKLDKPICKQMVIDALKVGYRMLDCACDYGNEVQVGEGIKEAIEQKICTREDIFVTSKLWNTFHRKEHVREGLMKTLTDLGLKYVDLYLIHFPSISLKYVPISARYPPEWVHDPSVANPKMELDFVSVQETWTVLEDLVDEGLIKAIGVCNMGVAGLADMLSYTKKPISVLQIEVHPYLTQERLVRWCQNQGIGVTAFSPLGSGSYEPFGWFKPEESVLRNAIVVDIAKKHQRTPAQIILRFGVQRDMVIIPKCSSIARLNENGALFDFTLTEDEMKAMYGLNRNLRMNDPGNFCTGMGGDCPVYL